MIATSFSSSGGIFSTGESRMHVLLRLLEVVRQVAQLAHHRRVVDEGVEVAQHEQPLALDAGDVVERLDRIAHVAAAELALQLDEAARDRPRRQHALAAQRDLPQRLLDARLLRRDDVESG